MAKLSKNIELTLDDLNLNEEEKEELIEKISDALSDKYGFCHYGWKSETIKLKGVDWDTTE